MYDALFTWIFDVLLGVVYFIAGQKLSDGKPLSGPGRLTLAMVDSFQVWYGQAIRNNKGDADKMSDATLAILYHYSEKADHSYCPKVKDSWCKWQSDVITGETTYTPVSNPLPLAVVEQIKPVFEFLSNKKLLQGCVNCLTQNQNESLHHAVWRFVPKDQYHSSNEVEVGIRMGILKFNEGITKMSESMFDACGIKYTENMERQYYKMDKDRIYCAEVKVKASNKQMRKEKRQKHKRKTDAFRHKEGPTYKSGHFHLQQSQSKPKAGPKCKRCGQPRKGHARSKCS